MIRINGFQFKHLLVKNFWWLFKKAGQNLLGMHKPGFLISPDKTQVIEVSPTGLPDSLFWDNNYRCCVVATLFSSRVIMYENPYPPLDVVNLINTWTSTKNLSKTTATAPSETLSTSF